MPKPHGSSFNDHKVCFIDFFNSITTLTSDTVIQGLLYFTGEFYRHAKRPDLLKDVFNLLYTMDVNVISANSRTEAEYVYCELQLEATEGGIDEEKIVQIKKVCQLQNIAIAISTYTNP